jgi:hypothetical protein
MELKSGVFLNGKLFYKESLDELEAAISAEAEARNAAIAAAELGSQVWLPAVQTWAGLPDPAALSPAMNYLCRVIDDADQPANNGVWQVVAGASDWTYFQTIWILSMKRNLRRLLAATPGLFQKMRTSFLTTRPLPSLIFSGLLWQKQTE